ncbi:uncharacterized protein LOC127706439 [Mytilus californianus]|uniref:uncharacterized protein LOC127706439 n=1 Tax=Mytilus californianus TaxID=6549 RepID=UPI0022456BED|nr:uncharacterized protein LOC127706439 [Mytilus californianus]
MARNEEKQLGRLNRLWLKQQKDEQHKKNPKRPRLDDINTAEDIKHWLPSIKDDIDFCLKQSQVPCYPEAKIKEFNLKIDHLQRQYKAFVWKLRKLDPEVKQIPWVERGYTTGQKRKLNGDESVNVQKAISYEMPFCQMPAKSTNMFSSCEDSDTTLSSGSHKYSVGANTNKELDETPCDQQECKNFLPLETPILSNDSEYRNTFGYLDTNSINQDNIANVNLELQDQPLTFVKTNLSKNKTREYSTKNIQNMGDNSLQTLFPYSDSSSDNGD